MDLGLKGKNVLITGGSMGIGRACANLFASEGANLALTARTDSTLEEAVSELEESVDVKVVGYPGDMGVQDDVDRVAAQALE
ncbi:MAG: SDR family NAD(P)-dependent oxidoreductase, partial [Acidimicrobiia bacterium]